jgi:hypothetical protein
MSGTEWTEPGKGATIYDLIEAVELANVGQDTDEKQQTIDMIEANPKASSGFYVTNLKLTGAPLTAEDLERIGRAK